MSASVAALTYGALFRSLILVSTLCIFLFFFFFQAEDGIRAVAVTGVQTCALPISFSRIRHDLGDCIRRSAYPMAKARWLLPVSPTSPRLGQCSYASLGPSTIV